MPRAAPLCYVTKKLTTVSDQCLAAAFPRSPLESLVVLACRVLAYTAPRLVARNKIAVKPVLAYSRYDRSERRD